MVILNEKDCTATFVYTSTAKPKTVFLVGDFNGWDPTVRRMVKTKDGSYRAKLELGPGEYEYKFVVDGEWLADADASANRPNCYGTLNSVVIIDDPNASCGCECECCL